MAVWRQLGWSSFHYLAIVVELDTSEIPQRFFRRNQLIYYAAVEQRPSHVAQERNNAQSELQRLELDSSRRSDYIIYVYVYDKST